MSYKISWKYILFNCFIKFSWNSAWEEFVLVHAHHVHTCLYITYACCFGVYWINEFQKLLTSLPPISLHVYFWKSGWLVVINMIKLCMKLSSYNPIYLAKYILSCTLHNDNFELTLTCNHVTYITKTGTSRLPTSRKTFCT